MSYEELYAFSYNPKQSDQQRDEGWQLIDLGAEFERMGVPCDQWQLTNVNRDYKVGEKSSGGEYLGKNGCFRCKCFFHVREWNTSNDVMGFGHFKDILFDPNKKQRTSCLLLAVGTSLGAINMTCSKVYSFHNP